MNNIPLHYAGDRRDAPVPPYAAALVEAYPLAWIVSRDGDALLSTPLPLVAEYGADGSLASLLGHFARANRHVAALEKDRHATILFSGPAGYISPQYITDPTWAPTWNYSVVRFRCRLDFVPEENGAALRRLTGQMEAVSGGDWTVDQVGSKYDAMLARIIAFRAEIIGCEANMKLGQDERDENFDAIVAGLGDTPLARWMERARGRDG